MEFIKKNRVAIGTAITFLVGGLTATGYVIPAPFVDLIRSALGV